MQSEDYRRKVKNRNNHNRQKINRNARFYEPKRNRTNY
jgi:hypothetical protein